MMESPLPPDGEARQPPSKDDKVALKDVRGSIFRANPAFELILFDRLPPEKQQVFQDLKNDPEFYGVLVPRDSTFSTIKAVCRNSALLYFTLLQPGPLPSYLQAEFGDSCNQAIVQLVLDGVLEMQHGDRFVSGSNAFELIYESDANQPQPEGMIARLTLSALGYGQMLDLDDTARLSARLYFYNRIPLSERWRRRLPSEEAVLAYLQMERHRKLLDQRWSKIQSSLPFGGWLQWQSRQGAHMNGRPKEKHGYKLYVSPTPEFVPEAFRAVIELPEALGPNYFKVGSDAAGLLRPDKLVLYFSSFDMLQACADRLSSRLGGCPAHGVPFTAALQTGAADEGLFSWGADPPADKGALSWQERESWRLFITNRLASAMISAKKAATPGLQPSQFALERLRLEGIDTGKWIPTSSFAMDRRS
ncbi:MAG: hypothetical protein JO108_01190 [Acidobacteriaceae bacterium]|nr:hypothetical protein [Acidobacteriaceae bacterium]